MEMTRNAINTIGALAAGLTTFLFGARDGWLWALLAFVALDYITGVIAAWMTKTLSSEVGAKGLAKKVLLLAIVSMANILDTATGAGGVLRNLVIGFYLANEGLSLIENASRCGVPVPPKLVDTLAQLKDGGAKQPAKPSEKDE